MKYKMILFMVQKKSLQVYDQSLRFKILMKNRSSVVRKERKPDSSFAVDCWESNDKEAVLYMKN